MNLPKLTQRHGVGKCSWKNDTSKGFPYGSVGKESTCNILTWLGRSPGEGHGSPLQYSFLENPHAHKSLVGYSPLGHKASDTTKQLSTDLTQSCHKPSICKIHNIVEAQSMCDLKKKKEKKKCAYSQKRADWGKRMNTIPYSEERRHYPPPTPYPPPRQEEGRGPEKHTILT